jgi:hypothetical protein
VERQRAQRCRASRFNLTGDVFAAHQSSFTKFLAKFSLMGWPLYRGVPVGGDSTMIVELFDRRTMASMEVALDRACERWPCGGKHNLRKLVAQAIIRCAKTGNTSLDALTEAGERALVQLPQGSGRSVELKGADVRPNWQNAA